VEEYSESDENAAAVAVDCVAAEHHENPLHDDHPRILMC